MYCNFYLKFNVQALDTRQFHFSLLRLLAFHSTEQLQSSITKIIKWRQDSALKHRRWSKVHHIWNLPQETKVYPMHVNTVHTFSIIVVFRCKCCLRDLESFLNTNLHVYVLIILFIYNTKFITNVWLIFLKFYINKEANLKEERRFFDRDRSGLAWHEASKSVIQTAFEEPEQTGFGKSIRNGKFWIIFIYLLFLEWKLQYYLVEAQIGCHKALPE